MKLPSRYGAAAEKRVAKLTQSRRTPGSGSKWFAKADLKNATHLTEVKATAKKSYTLNIRTFLKIEREALAQDKIPQFIIEFDDPRIGRHYLKIERL